MILCLNIFKQTNKTTLKILRKSSSKTKTKKNTLNDDGKCIDKSSFIE